MSQQGNPYLTITLTGRPPVKITKESWPIYAEASDEEYAGQHKFQASRLSEWALKVRRHEDGRAIVYGVYTHTSHYLEERDFDIRGGELLSREDSLPDAIRRVGEWMATQEHSGDDARRWKGLVHKCVADLPAEELA